MDARRRVVLGGARRAAGGAPAPCRPRRSPTDADDEPLSPLTGSPTAPLSVGDGRGGGRAQGRGLQRVLGVVDGELSALDRGLGGGLRHGGVGAAGVWSGCCRPSRRRSCSSDSASSWSRAPSWTRASSCSTARSWRTGPRRSPSPAPRSPSRRRCSPTTRMRRSTPSSCPTRRRRACPARSGGSPAPRRGRPRPRSRSMRASSCPSVTCSPGLTYTLVTCPEAPKLRFIVLAGDRLPLPDTVGLDDALGDRDDALAGRRGRLPGPDDDDRGDHAADGDGAERDVDRGQQRTSA